MRSSSPASLLLVASASKVDQFWGDFINLKDGDTVVLLKGS